MAPSGLQILLIIILLVLLFGRGRIAALMGEVAKGIKSFRAGLKEGGLKDESQKDKAQIDERDMTDDSDVIDIKKSDDSDHESDK